MKKTSWVYYAFFLFFGVFAGIQLTKWMVRKTIPTGHVDLIKQLIINNYVDTVDVSKLNEAAVEAMLNSLDPHSAYLPLVLAQKADDDLMGKFDGIGVLFRMIDDTVTVMQPLSGGPSEKVGILAGDRIIRVDSVTVSGVKMDMDDIMKRLKGKKGTSVNVEIQRSGVYNLLNFKIIRNAIPTYSVDVDFMVEQSIGYIKLSKFSATTSEEIRNALKRLLDQGMDKLIFDLRGNGGGFLHEAINVADEFLSEGKPIVYTEGLNRPKQEAFATHYGIFENKSIVVLMDEWSASASEIIAGALQDNDYGTIVGRRSFGKGLVQEQIKLSNGASIRLTVARYHTPTGRCIQDPYTQGEDDFEKQLIKRMNGAEQLSFDSIRIDTTQKFYTPEGRVVYGGGGIIPDVYVPYVTDSTFIYANLLSYRGFTLRYTFNYSNSNRKYLLKNYPDVDTFKAKFTVSENLFKGLIAYAETQGLKPDFRCIQRHENHLKSVIKAYIARDLYGDKGFYPIYLSLDPDFKKAMEILKK